MSRPTGWRLLALVVAVFGFGVTGLPASVSVGRVAGVRASVLVWALLAGLATSAAGSTDGEARERALFRSVGRYDIASRSPWLSAVEAARIVEQELADLAANSAQGYPNPRAVKRLNELRGLIEQRAPAPSGTRADRPAQAAQELPELVYVAKYRAKPGAEFHKENCAALVGIIRQIPLNAALRTKAEPCPSCFPALAGDGKESKDLAARRAEQERRAVLAEQERAQLAEEERRRAERERENSAAASSAGTGEGSSSGSSESSEVDAQVEEIKQTIRKHCEKQWPDDFAMRAYCEKKQLEGVRELAQGRPSDVSAEDWETICAKASEKWPTDYQMQAYTRRKQVEGLQALR